MECLEKVTHPEAVGEARSVLEGAPTAELAETFRILGDPTRLRILLALSVGELCVCDLAELFDVTPSAISHQLRLLRAHGFVRSRRDGKMAYYRLDDDGHVRGLFTEGLRQIEEGR